VNIGRARGKRHPRIAGAAGKSSWVPLLPGPSGTGWRRFVVWPRTCFPDLARRGDQRRVLWWP